MCLVVLLLPALAPFLLALLLLISAAPAMVIHLLLTRPDTFGEFWFGWVLSLAAAPFLAYGLAGWRFAPTRRLRAERAARRDRSILVETPADRRARRNRRRLQSAILLPVNSVAGMFTLLGLEGTRGTEQAVGFALALGVIPVLTAMMSTLFRIWDDRSPPLIRPGRRRGRQNRCDE